ncbi:MAG: hypothetical protein JXQ75_06660 [Phycisphaerae bacterium]|nr:hypothetical protein [Phycisphaerae bacterium]
MMRPSTRKWLFVLLAGVLLLAASSRVGPLYDQREEHQLVLPPLPDTVRPSMLLSPLLAVGRAPLVDYLWMRATQLKDRGLFFDAYQLSQMICELQPKFASVWAFQGWNMAYNISVTLKSPEERWRWVRNGYELIRDKGIPLNPNNTQLYKELAWILFHKVGDTMDEMHYYYKLQFALIMEDILGKPPDDYARAGRARGDFYRNYDYKSLADAPLAFGELLDEPGVADFVEKLKAFGFDAGEEGAFLGLLASLEDETVKIPDVEPGREEATLYALKELMSDPQTEGPRTAIEKYWRAYRLRNEVKLDPRRIVQLHEAFGVIFDFRLAEAHAIYWTSLGLEKGLGRQEAVDVHRLNTQRIVFYSLQKMFQRGRMAMSRNADLGEPPLLSPDIRMTPVLRAAIEEGSQYYLDMEKPGKQVSENFRTAYVGFMRSAIIRYHELGMQKEAKAYFDDLKKIFPDPMYDKGLDGFLAEQFRFDREIDDYRVALARIRALIHRGLVQYAYDEDEEAGLCFRRAKQIYDNYQKNIVSARLRIPFKYTDILVQMTHETGGGMYRGSYEHICEKLGIEPLPPKQGGE